MTWPSTRYRTATAGGAWGWDSMNGIQDWLLRPNGLEWPDFSPGLLGLGGSASDDNIVATTWTPGVSRPIEDLPFLLGAEAGSLVLAWGEAIVNKPIGGDVRPELCVRISDVSSGDEIASGPWVPAPSGLPAIVRVPPAVLPVRGGSSRGVVVSLVLRGAGGTSPTVLTLQFRKLRMISYAF